MDTDTLRLDLWETALADAWAPPTLIEQFRAFDAANPQVYRALVDLARGLVAAGHKRFGIAMLFEVLRWQTAMTTTDPVWKLNNSYRSLYARLIMSLEDDLAGVFELRELRCDR